MSTKTVIILVGLPGAGKSTRTQTLADIANSKGQSVAVHSTDAFFIKNGVYTFDGRRLGEYHSRNQVAYLRSLIRGVDVVIVDNTNLKHRDREDYAEPAREAGYNVVYEVVGSFDEASAEIYASRNLHGVPPDKVIKMAHSYEPVSN